MVAPDLVGHGAGPEWDKARDFHTQATEEAARYLGDRPCHLIGHSFGATLALRLAVEQPERVATLTLIEPVLFCVSNGPGRAAHDLIIAPMARHLAEGDPVGAARVFLAQWGSLPFDAMPEAHRRYMADRIWVPGASEPALIADTADLVPRLGQVNCPTLLIDGATSLPVIDEIQSVLAARLPDVRRVTISGAGHMAPMTHPGETARAIRLFLDAVSPGHA